MNPPRILDPIITTLLRFYQTPKCLPPLDADPDCNGKPSDHLMVVMTPISVLNNKCVRTVRKITTRPISELGLQKMQQWLENESWSEVTESCANQKTEILQTTLLNKYFDFFPEKTRTVSSDDQPFFKDKLSRLKRKKGREYSKHRRSAKWKKMEVIYNQELAMAKKGYYRKRIKNLPKSKPGKWLKKITCFDQQKSENITVENIKDLPVPEQAELIADRFARVSQEYEKLRDEDIKIPEFSENEMPQFDEDEVRIILSQMDTNKSNVCGDIPAKILKTFAVFIAKPVKDLLNCLIRQERWPDIFKLEIVTPVPKEYPTKDISQLRNISGLLNLNKVASVIQTNN